MRKVTGAEFTCNMCSETFYVEENLDYINSGVVPCKKDRKNEYEFDWVFQFDLPVPGYGSFLDNTTLEKIHICDDCLCEIYNSLEIKPEVLSY